MINNVSKIYFGLIKPATNFNVWFGISMNQKITFKVSLLTLWHWSHSKQLTHFFLLSEMAILKLVGVTAVFFLSGLLPWIDNYAHLFGFIFGFLISYAIMPFVTFGIYDRKRKLILLWICLLSCIVIFVGLILLFYVTPIHDCEICKYFNCIPITKDFCSEQNIDLRETVWWRLFSDCDWLILGHETPEILTSDWLILAIQVANQTKPATDRLNALVKHDLTITLHA